MLDAILALSTDDLRRLAAALRGGRLDPPYTAVALQPHVSAVRADNQQIVAAYDRASDRVVGLTASSFVTLSFDPARDTPAVMRRYGGSRVSDEGDGVRWYFLTTRSARELMPLVEGFGQDIQVTLDRSNGTPRRELSHVLKVFLIDRAGFVREIYTSTFLHPRTVLNDIETLLMEEDVRP